MRVEIGTWENGDPITIERYSVSNLDDGITQLIEIGRSGIYNVDFAAYVVDHNGENLVRLNIYSKTRWDIMLMENGEWTTLEL